MVLKNNLRVLLVPRNDLQSVLLNLWVKTGSRFEEDKKAGLSHFLEHMVFKGSKKRPSAKAISESIDSIGAEANAATSKEWTNFYIKSRSDVIEKSIDILSDIVLYPLLKKEEIEKEKGVILEEIAMYEDTPMIKIYDIFENITFAGSPLARDIAGTKETVSSLKREDFLAYRKNYYYPENMLLTVVGNFKEEKILRLIKRYFGELEGTGKEPLSAWDNFGQKKPNVFLKSKKTDQAHLIVGFRGAEFGHKDRYAETVLSSILGGGMSSRMFIEVREKRGLAYAVKVGVDHGQDTGSFLTYAGVQTTKIKEAINVILDQYFGLRDKKYKINESEFKKAKEYLKGHFALSLENTHTVCDFFSLDELYLGKIRKIESVFEEIDSVSQDDVYRVADNFFQENRLNVAVIGPYENKEELGLKSFGQGPTLSV